MANNLESTITKHKREFDILKIAIKDAVKDPNYYFMDVKHVEDKDSTKKVQIAVKVFVPENDRKKVT